jgi:hypothetical protein
MTRKDLEKFLSGNSILKSASGIELNEDFLKALGQEQ